MKKIAIVILLASVAALAKKRELPTYDHTGQITGFIWKYNAEAHSTVGNTTVDAYCDVANSRVDCYDSPGLTYIVLDDGGLNPWPAKEKLYDRTPWFNGLEQCPHYKQGHMIDKYGCDPLFEVYETAKVHYTGGRMEPIKFQYRVAGSDTYCVARTDAEGMRQHKEVCYYKALGVKQ